MNNRKDMPRRRLEGYYQGSSGHRTQFEFDGPEYGRRGGSYQTFGDDARWKNDAKAQHYNLDHYGWGNRERSWNKNIDNQDQHNNGYNHGHYGKGPKGYRRSSQRIYEDVGEALTLHPDVDASEIEINVDDGIVTLTGTVESRKVKRLAEMIVDNVLGVEDVVNLLSMVGVPKASDMKTTGSPLGDDANKGFKSEKRH
jgi:hypothetical protein